MFETILETAQTAYSTWCAGGPCANPLCLTADLLAEERRVSRARITSLTPDHTRLFARGAVRDIVLDRVLVLEGKAAFRSKKRKRRSDRKDASTELRTSPVTNDKDKSLLDDSKLAASCHTGYAVGECGSSRKGHRNALESVAPFSDMAKIRRAR